MKRQRFTLRACDKAIELGERTLIMGVLNVTPDSFSDGGVFLEPSKACERAWQICHEGADILDIGGESSRPGSDGISLSEELRRVIPVLDALAGKYPLPISIDTSKAEVARAALERGAVLINDITGLQRDPRIAAEAAASQAGLILMHMRGTPKTMQAMAPSPDILAEIDHWSKEAVARARNSGVSCDQIILDPGIGFGKSVHQNLEILRNLDRLAGAGFPLLVGTSRKSFIGVLLNKPEGERIWGTAATVAASILFGAHIVRVHDIAPMRDIARIMDTLVS